MRLNGLGADESDDESSRVTRVLKAPTKAKESTDIFTSRRMLASGRKLVNNTIIERGIIRTSKWKSIGMPPGLCDY
jgi:hypothetical protein